MHAVFMAFVSNMVHWQIMLNCTFSSLAKNTKQAKATQQVAMAHISWARQPDLLDSCLA
jgi:hypothetical protein